MQNEPAYSTARPERFGWYDCRVDGKDCRLRFRYCQSRGRYEWLDEYGNRVTGKEVEWCGEPTAMP